MNEWGSDFYTQVSRIPNLRACLTRDNNELITSGEATGTLPTDVSFFSKGCILIKSDQASTSSPLYVNIGDESAPSWKNILTESHDPFVTVGYSFADYIVDGVADEVQINQAIAAVSAAGGGEVRLKSGIIFHTAGSILMKSNVRLSGGGIGNTIIEGSTADYPVIFTTKSGTTKDVYSSIILNGITVLSLKGHCTRFDNVSVLGVFECEFYFSGTTTIRESLRCEHCQYVWMGENYLHDLTGDGVQVNSTDYFTVFNNIVDGGVNSDDGIDIDEDFLDTSAIRSRYGTIVGNVVKNIYKGNGIRVEDAINVAVIGNTISGIYVTTGNPGGIKVNIKDALAVSTISVVGNTIEDCVSNGLTIGGDSGNSPSGGITNVIIANNTLTNCGQSGGTNVRSGIQIFAVGVSCVGNFLDTCGVSGGNQGGIVVYRVNNIKISQNRMSNCSMAVRLWNGDLAQSYTGIEISNNYFDTSNAANLFITALVDGEVFNNYGVNPIKSYTQGNITGATIFNRVNGDVITGTFTGNVTTTITDGTFKGDKLTLILTQGGGGNTISKPANVKLVGGAFSPSAGAGAIDSWSLEWDGTNWNEISRALNLS